MEKALDRRSLFRSLLRTVHSDKTTKPHVVFDPKYCLSYSGGFCTVCIERCPSNGAVVNVNEMPRFQKEHCTACGTCIEVCPAPVIPLHLSTVGP